MDAGTNNWIKSVFGLKYLRSGIMKFVEETSKRLHQEMKKNVGPDKCTEMCNCKKETFCDICEAWKYQIKRYKVANLEWNNSNPCDWSSEPWEVMKVYMPKGQKKGKKKGPKDSDASGLVKLMDNNKYFLDLMPCVKIHKLQKVMEIRNILFHPSDDMSVEDADMKNYIDIFLYIVSISAINRYQDAQQSVKDLEKLKDSNFVMTSADKAEAKASRSRSQSKPKQRKFHFCVIYNERSDESKTFAQYIVKELEKENHNEGGKIIGFFPERDRQPGQFLIDENKRAVKDSDYTIVIFDKKFSKNGEAKYFSQLGLYQHIIKDEHDRLIPVAFCLTREEMEKLHVEFAFKSSVYFDSSYYSDLENTNKLLEVIRNGYKNSDARSHADEKKENKGPHGPPQTPDTEDLAETCNTTQAEGNNFIKRVEKELGIKWNATKRQEPEDSNSISTENELAAASCQAERVLEADDKAPGPRDSSDRFQKEAKNPGSHTTTVTSPFKEPMKKFPDQLPTDEHCQSDNAEEPGTEMESLDIDKDIDTDGPDEESLPQFSREAKPESWNKGSLEASGGNAATATDNQDTNRKVLYSDMVKRL